jgi:hypothetical protein
MGGPVRPLPPETWKPYPPDTIVEVPIWPRDDWGRDKVDAKLLGSETTADIWVGVPVELLERVTYEGEVFVLMRSTPHPEYWLEAA